MDIVWRRVWSIIVGLVTGFSVFELGYAVTVFFRVLVPDWPHGDSIGFYLVVLGIAHLAMLAGFAVWVVLDGGDE